MEPTEAAGTVSEAVKNPCHDVTYKHQFAIDVMADDGREHWFGISQFLDAELGPNPAVDEDQVTHPERLHVRFATGEVIVIGRKLHRLAQLIQRGELERIRPIGGRYAGLSNSVPIILSITVTRKEEP